MSKGSDKSGENEYGAFLNDLIEAHKNWIALNDGIGVISDEEFVDWKASIPNTFASFFKDKRHAQEWMLMMTTAETFKDWVDGKLNGAWTPQHTAYYNQYLLKKKGIKRKLEKMDEMELENVFMKLSVSPPPPPRSHKKKRQKTSRNDIIKENKNKRQIGIINDMVKYFNNIARFTGNMNEGISSTDMTRLLSDHGYESKKVTIMVNSLVQSWRTRKPFKINYIAQKQFVIKKGQEKITTKKNKVVMGYEFIIKDDKERWSVAAIIDKKYRSLREDLEYKGTDDSDNDEDVDLSDICKDKATKTNIKKLDNNEGIVGFVGSDLPPCMGSNINTKTFDKDSLFEALINQIKTRKMEIFEAFGSIGVKSEDEIIGAFMNLTEEQRSSFFYGWTMKCAFVTDLKKQWQWIADTLKGMNAKLVPVANDNVSNENE